MNNPFKQGSQAYAAFEIIERMVGISDKGVSGWVDLEQFDADLYHSTGKKSSGNGNTLIQNDRGLGAKFYVEKDKPIAKSSKQFTEFRLAGTKEETQKIHRKTISASGRCVFCGRSSNLHADHKNGRHTGIEDHEYQTLCQSCKTLKRERCRACAETGVRFDARSIGYNINWLSGDSLYNPRHGCLGCMWFDVEEFRRQL